jgi:Zn-dependent protease
VIDLSSDPRRRCLRCATELSPHALACPACNALVHRERLEQLAELAQAAEAADDPATARTHWQEARELVPPRSEQYKLMGARIDAQTERLTATPNGAAAAPTNRSWNGGAAGVAVAVGLLVVGKLKFLLLGLSKLSTLASMFGFILVYWAIHGWPLAVGLAGTIYIHEMGHVAMLRRLGINASAPLFIPGVGALVMLKQHITDPIADARIGLAGPVWGLGAAVAAWVVYQINGAPIWLAIAELTGFLNLFNLMPIWQLDGSRGFHALSRSERWMVVGAIAAALALTGVRLLWILAAVAIYRTVRGEQGPGHQPTFLTFAGLVLALSWFARAVQ